ncbi:MAG TPA: hypothetical protein VMT63_02710 [Bacteroidales bacterium]|nr:hypothetical protein [Bacteroidales bacterium]
MKKCLFLIFIALATINLTAQTTKQKHNPEGKWEFEAPSAPGGYTSGVVEVTKTDSKLTATMSFSGNDYKFPVDQVKFENDTLKINLNVDGTDVNIRIKFEEPDKLSGVAVTNDGEIPLTLTRSKGK